MKKPVIGFVIATSVLFSTASVDAAVEQIRIDGVAVEAEVKPVVKDNRVMVPLRVVSENLGATVDWTSSRVVLTRSDLQLTLSLSDGEVHKNGERLAADVKPYLQNDRLLVPLRLIAEAFGAQVDYRDRTVSIHAEPLMIDGVKIGAVLQDAPMTMGSVTRQLNGRSYHEDLYALFHSSLTEPITAPEYYGRNALLDNPGSYQQYIQYDFLNAEGSPVAGFAFYALTRAFPDEELVGLPGLLLHDVINDEWYEVDDALDKAVRALIDRADHNGFMGLVSNTVV
ncbi:copper amine oxidase N-terminal domain-containing protein [Paenibacillus sp. 1P07SE]|uniref:copper amine oxidase N-terminal domain-containing protein n=1 Tax=Paenibacillus sp. 1P07SE TaxID=3132209 RepID=UPI0039A6C1AF